MPPRAVVVIGRGRMGLALGAALRRAGVAARVRAARRWSQRPARGAKGSVAWILAVRDADLEATARTVSSVARRGDVALHLAGMRGPEALAALAGVGVATGSFHPLIAVAKGNRAGVAPGGAFVFEGARAAGAEARRVASALGCRVVVAATVRRAAYHAGAALVATGAVALAQGATAMFARALAPVPDDRAMRAAVASLLRSVASNVEAVGARRALASPLLRDDTATVARHLDEMSAEPAARALYRAAVALVLDALEAERAVKPETISAARALVAQG